MGHDTTTYEYPSDDATTYEYPSDFGICGSIYELFQQFPKNCSSTYELPSEFLRFAALVTISALRSDLE